MLSSINLVPMRLQQAWISLARTPGFWLGSALTLCLTLGVLLAVIALLQNVVLAPLPYPQQQRLFSVEHQMITHKSNETYDYFTYPGAELLYREQQPFEQVAMVDYEKQFVTSLAAQPNVNVAYVTPEWLSLLGTPLKQGRVFSESELLHQPATQALLSEQFVDQYFDSSDDVLGKNIEVAGQTYNIIGIVSEQFREPQLIEKGRQTAIWLPFDYNPTDFFRDRWSNIVRSIFVIGLINEGVSKTQAQTSLTQLIQPEWKQQNAGIPVFKDWRLQMQVVPLKQRLLGDVTSSLYLLFFAVVLISVIALSNLLNLFWGRVVERQHNFIIELALGAKSRHLFRRLCYEMLVVMFSALPGIVMVAYLSNLWLKNNLQQWLPRAAEMNISSTSVVIVIMLMLLLTFMFARLGVIPLKGMVRQRNLAQHLQKSGKGNGAQTGSHIRMTLMTLQIALGVMLVFASFMLLNRAASTIQSPDSIELDNVWQVTVRSLKAQIDSADEMSAMLQIKQTLLAQPEIELVSQSMSPLDEGVNWLLGLSDTQEKLSVEGTIIDASYFTALQQRFVDGRDFTQQEWQQGDMLVVINQALAKQLGASGKVLDRLINFGDERNYRVIGVVENRKLADQLTEQSRLYVLSYKGSNDLLVKFKQGRSSGVTQLANIIKQANSQYGLFKYSSLVTQRQQLLFADYISAAGAAALALLSILLVAMGIGGVMQALVYAQRTQFGIRLAIGANPTHIFKALVKQIKGAFVLGTFAALIASATCVTLMNLNDFQQLELTTVANFVGSVLLIGCIVIGSSYVPFKRQMDKSINQLLRQE